jgi:hypothetical protein
MFSKKVKMKKNYTFFLDQVIPAQLGALGRGISEKGQF